MMHQAHCFLWFVVYNVLIVWCVEMQCDEWVMHSMMQCVMNRWCMGDAWLMHDWCYLNEWMNEWMDGWMNEWINEWVVNKWACGQCRMTVCILLYFICICNMSLYLFRAIFYATNKQDIPYGQGFVILHTNPTCDMWFINFKDGCA